MSHSRIVLTKLALNEMLMNRMDQTILSEMRMAPDQSNYPLTRRQVEKMLAQYERREDEDNWNDDPEYRSMDGWLKAKWFAPETEADFGGEDMDKSGANRPAKLMPFDYYYTNQKQTDKEEVPPFYKVNDNDDNDEEELDKATSWKGENNAWS